MEPKYLKDVDPPKTYFNVGDRIRFGDGSWSLVLNAGGLSHYPVAMSGHQWTGRIVAMGCLLPSSDPEVWNDTIVACDSGKFVLCQARHLKKYL